MSRDVGSTEDLGDWLGRYLRVESEEELSYEKELRGTDVFANRFEASDVCQRSMRP